MACQGLPRRRLEYTPGRGGRAISARRRDERAEYRDDRRVVALAPAARHARDQELAVQRGREQRRWASLPSGSKRSVSMRSPLTSIARE